MKLGSNKTSILLLMRGEALQLYTTSIKIISEKLQKESYEKKTIIHILILFL